MKSRVRVANEIFEVEIKDLNARPIEAIVDGVAFEIWPDEIPTAIPSQKQRKQPTAEKPSIKKPAAPVTSARQVFAPIPGVINAVSVAAGDNVTVGQELCVLEAMKMNNSVRANRAGIIAKVNVTVGQHVKHHEVLFEFNE